ncbi:MAG: hypothetical protein K6E86_02745 [Bacteroidales bacterium]|nr:hypothetical protein [Bacteroidales bacterium]
MNNIEPEMEKPIIIIEERPESEPNQGPGEVPVINVERSDPKPSPQPVRTHRRRFWVAGGALVAVLGCISVWAIWRYYRDYVNIGVPVSVSSNENISKLQAPVDQSVQPEVTVRYDSVLGVAMNIYAMQGLRAEISMHEPDTADMDVYLYSRCADYHKDFSIIGDMVIGGEEIETAESNRKGYFAADQDNFVIGIARDNKVKQYAMENGGCFFRQYILLSDRTIPRSFYLHGKVERRAFGRMANDKIYYIATLHKETMWDFADALREYGFVDAIYITGGYDYSFYRSADGSRHDISDPARYPHKYPGHVPWVVFRRR